MDGKLIEQILLHYLPPESILHEGDEGFIKQAQLPENSQAAAYNKIFSTLFNLDIDEGLKNCGGAENFMETAQNFYETIPTKMAELAQFLKAGDIRNYTIQVHALKTCARLIGAKELSTQAAYLEQCGNEGNIDALKSKTPAMLAFYHSFRRALWPFSKQNRNPSEERQAIQPEELAEALKALKEMVTVYDFDSADEIISELDKFILPPDFAEKYARIKEKVKAVDQQSLLALLP